MGRRVEQEGRAMKTKTDFRMFDDVRRSAGPEVYHTPEDVDCRVSANVGDIMAVALSAAGQSVLRLGGSYAVETDYLAACAATASGSCCPNSWT